MLLFLHLRPQRCTCRRINHVGNRVARYVHMNFSFFRTHLDIIIYLIQPKKIRKGESFANKVNFPMFSEIHGSARIKSSLALPDDVKVTLLHKSNSSSRKRRLLHLE
jgi:hypothetical protein